jgi:tetratricopeptide (TPR) repeat protein
VPSLATVSFGLLACSWIFAQSNSLQEAARKASEGDYREAISILKDNIKSGPKSDDRVYLLMGDCYLRIQSPAEAEDTLRSGLRAFPGSALLERSLGELLFRLRYNNPEAGVLLSHAAKALVKDPEARHYSAQWAHLNEKDSICADQENLALKSPGLTDPALLQMLTLLGMCESQLNCSDGARAAFRRANEINLRQPPYDSIATLQYVSFLLRMNHEPEAEQLVDQILARVPGFGPALLEKAKFHDRRKEPEEAIAEAEQALRSEGIDLNAQRAARSLLARCHFQLGHTEEATREQQWIASHPNPETPPK